MSFLPHELIVDNFAGGGGTSTGLEQAFGRPVDIAINHDPKALAMHRINHPETTHYCESVWDIDPVEVTGNQPVGLVWLSPDCKHFSKAKGGKPVEKKIRALAWIALRWAAKARPRVIILENVEEFKTWGRVGEDGKPCPKHRGETFQSFVKALNRQGYEVEWRELRACDYGSPTIRKRFFLIARRDGIKIQWPAATHGNPESIQVQKGHLKPWRTAAECIDWSIECPSIFNRRRPLAEATMNRIAKGLDKFVLNSGNPFIVKANHTASYYRYFRGQSLMSPLQTITSAPGFAIVAPVLTECANASNPRSMPINEPLRTICAQMKGGHHALMVSHLSKMRNNCVGQGATEPMHTITAGGGHFAEVRAFLTAFYGNEKDGNSVQEPLRTIPTRDRFGLVTINQQQYQITDIGFRMLQPAELFKAQGFPTSYIFDRGIDACGVEIRLTKTEQTRMVGNSVCPQLSRALVEANFKHELAYRGAA
ncbi:DNA cytosine methyltransferase [Acinetobacter bouvetii]|uniref:DNA (cytosine-5-)-methyltransferase n=1 Tax=Acinetobacter bouvetii TaxID=202951 RepID=A0A4Q7ANU4_9GAMM|nr:DNA cytosine methyltransferase [Acinetobacter bouvetii]RZG63615.1 DNA cytosine methyltransferase [Acinetobacter bouvetii]